jgi:hypothetical protein
VVCTEKEESREGRKDRADEKWPCPGVWEEGVTRERWQQTAGVESWEPKEERNELACYLLIKARLDTDRD